MKIKIKKLNSDASIPRYASDGSAGFDLEASSHTVLFPGDTVAVPTGLAFEIPTGFEMQIRPRSGLSLNTPLRVTNAPGTIDSDYRGEVKILISHVGGVNAYNPIVIHKGDRIAQGIISEVRKAVFEEVTNLENTTRNGNGFGSTGL